MSRKTGTAMILFLVVVAPILVAVLILALGDKWFPAGDMAQAELHMRGFFDRPPLVGAAGRIVSDSGFQGSHPGPSLWVAMLPVYLLGGQSSDALMAAAASVHLVSIASILVFARRRFGNAFMSIIGLVILAILRSSGTDFMIEPWNPWLALLPFAAFVFVLVELIDPIREASGDASSRPNLDLVLAVVIGSHCVQSHAGYVLLVVPPLAFALFVVAHGRFMDSSRYGRTVRLKAASGPVLAAGATAIVMWLPPLLDQIRRKPGNLTILLQHFGSPEEPTIGLTRAMDIVVSQMNLFGPWLFGPNAPDSDPLKWIGFSLVSALFVGAWLATNERAERRFLSALAVFALLEALSIARIFGPFYEYTVRWLWLLTGLAVATSMFVLVRRFVPNPLRSLVGGSRSSVSLVTATLILSGVTIGQVVDRVKMPGATDSRILSGLIEQTASRLDPEQTYQVRFYDPYTLNATGFGLVLELERRGFDVKVDPEFAAAALPHRTAPMAETDRVLWVVVGPAIEKASQDPSLTLLSTFNPRSTQEQLRSRQLLVEVEQGLRDAGRLDLVASLESPGASILFAEPPLPEETAELVRELIRMGQPTSVFSMSARDTATSLQ